MNKFLIFLFLLTIIVVAQIEVFAQTRTWTKTRNEHYPTPKRINKIKNSNIIFNNPDTLVPPAFGQACAGLGLYTFTVDGGGYVTGTNTYGDTEKAQKFNYTGGGQITEAGVYFGIIKPAAVPGNITVKIYATDASGNPGSLLGESQPKPTNQLTTTGNITPFAFNNPVIVSEDFFVSVTVNTGNGDTLAIVHTDDGCGSGTAYEKWNTGAWHSINDAASWDLNIEQYIDVIITPVTTGLNNVAPNKTQFNIAPNPVTNQLLRFDYHGQTSASLTIQDITGKTLQLNTISPGINQTIQILPSTPPGIYFASLLTPKQSITRRFILTR